MTNPLSAHLLAQHATAADHFWYRLRVRAASRFIPQGATVIDVGAGAGVLGACLALSRPDVRYRFVEPDPKLRSHLQANFGADAEHVLGQRVPAVTCAALLDVIEHVEDDVGLIRKVAADLPKASPVILTVPAFQFLWSEWDETVGHVRRYRLTRLRNAVTEAGLHLKHSRYMFPELFPLAVLRKFSRAGSDDFPEIPQTLNSALYRVGVATSVLGRFAPVGTSAIAVAETP